MENCLVKQGKFVVGDNSIEKLGCFTVVVPAGTCEFGLGFINGTIIKCDNTTDTIKIKNGSTEEVLSFPYIVHDISIGGSDQRIKGTLTKKTTFEFDNLYHNRSIMLFNSEPIDSITAKVFGIGISANPDFRNIRIDSNYKNKGYITDLSVFEGKTKLAKVILPATAKGNINSFDSVYEYLTEITLSYCNITGDISSFRRCSVITSINIKSTNVGGTIESFVEGQCSLRSTNATVVVDCTDTNVTLNEVSISNVNVNITATGATVTDYSSGTLLGTYTKSGNSWSYPS